MPVQEISGYFELSLKDIIKIISRQENNFLRIRIDTVNPYSVE